LKNFLSLVLKQFEAMEVKGKVEKIARQTIQKPKQHSFLKYVLAIAAVSAVIYFSYKWLKIEKSGNVELSDERLNEFLQDSAMLNDCVQYALIATKSGFYPCFSCSDSFEIYLEIGEIWYIGETCYGENRYSAKELINKKLKFNPEVIGNKYEVLLEQKRKIYQYPLLPESQKRPFSLPRPPGNKQDN
jgi:hypothetical protein